MTVNGKRDGFTISDLRAVAEVAKLKRTDAERIFDQVVAAVGRWEQFAEEARVTGADTVMVARTHRLTLARG